MSAATGVNSYDIISTLQFYQMIKYWRGKHVIVLPSDLRSANFSSTASSSSSPHSQIDPSALRWTPLVIADH